MVVGVIIIIRRVSQVRHTVEDIEGVGPDVFIIIREVSQGRHVVRDVDGVVIVIVIGVERGV